MHTCICNDITCILYLHSYTCIRNVINTSKYIHMYNKRCLIISYQSKRQIVTILVPIIIEYQYLNKMTWNLTNCNSCQNVTFEIVYGSLQASLWAEPRRPHQPQRPLAFSILVLIKTIWPQTITVRTVPQVQTLYTEAVATTKFISGSHLDLTTNWPNDSVAIFRTYFMDLNLATLRVGSSPPQIKDYSKNQCSSRITQKFNHRVERRRLFPRGRYRGHRGRNLKCAKLQPQ